MVAVSNDRDLTPAQADGPDQALGTDRDHAWLGDEVLEAIAAGVVGSERLGKGEAVQVDLSLPGSQGQDDASGEKREFIAGCIVARSLRLR